MDEIDRANVEASRTLDAALAQATNRPLETPLIIDGFRVCLDCEVVIPENRLAALPAAVRCISCQEEKE